MTKNIYDKLSEERKELQKQGYIPDWFTTQGWQLFKERYLWNAKGVTDTFRRIAKVAADKAPGPAPDFLGDTWENLFFRELNSGRAAGSTPVLSNTGTPKGHSVSCSGGYVPDHIDGWYMSRHETAMLTKAGFGTSDYLGDIRPRGSEIKTGGTASGSLPVFQMKVDDMRKITQGTSRRGAWAGYTDIDHGDFWEIAQYLEHSPDGLNVGWVIRDSFIEKLNNQDPEALKRWKRVMKVRAVTGKGYILMIDKVNRNRPQMYKDLDLLVKASNLCTEITLFADEDHTFTCVLSSVNAIHYDDWAKYNTVFIMTVFLDCICQLFIDDARGKPGFEKSVRFSEKGRALGLGVLGFHTYLQRNMMPFEGLEAHLTNIQIFSHLHDESLKASQWMAREWGEPEWCKGYGVRNTHRTAVAPNTSSALLCGGVSQGIEPVVANVYKQGSTAGNLDRINPVFLDYMKEKGMYKKEVIDRVSNNNGSVQDEDWVSDEMKEVLKTAFEIDQGAILRLASARQPKLCQAQSLNLFFSDEEEEEYASAIHKQAVLDDNILSVYYMRSLSGVKASKGECSVCEG